MNASDAIIELAGQNVSWDGNGAVSWDLTVHDGMDSLAFGWWDDGGDQLNGEQLLGILSMEGCDDRVHRSTSGAGASRWCPDPAPGAHRATYTLHAGIMHGRLCILGIPAENNSLRGCDFEP